MPGPLSKFVTVRVVALLFAATASVSLMAQESSPPKTWIDPVTGHRIIRLTNEPGSASLYFNQNAYTGGGKKMVFTTPEGISVLDLKTFQEKSVVKGNARVIIAGHKTQNVYYTRDGAIYATDTDTLATRMIARLPPHSSISAVNADETLLGGTLVEDSAAVSKTPYTQSKSRQPQALDQPKNKGQMMEQRLAAHLPMRLFTIDVRTGAMKTLLHSTDWLNHLQFSPTDPTLLLFCHEGPWHKVDRIWTIHTDGTGLTNVHKRTIEMEIAGHEFWSADGQTIWFDLQTPRGEDFWLGGYNPYTGARTQYHLQRNEWSIHFNVSPDGKLFAGDGGDEGQVAHATDGKWIYLFHPELIANRGVQDPHLIRPGVFHAEKLVDMSRHHYRLEPNVNFTPDGKWLVFRSNMFGPTYAFAVEIAKPDGAAAQKPGPDPSQNRLPPMRAPANPHLPTLYIIGDSTVRNGQGDGRNGQWGWGDVIGKYFDPSKINVVNWALGGRSSRTYITEGHWSKVVAALKPGDFVIMQFGHNDGGALNDTSRARGSIKGVGDESQEIDNLLTKKHETVHTYGWYMRKYIDDTRAKGATPIVCSLIPRKIWRDGKIVRNSSDYAGWAHAVADAEHAPFVDLNNIVADQYDRMGPDAVNPLFGDPHTHTTRAGAELNAKAVITGLKLLANDPLAPYFVGGS